MRPIRLFCLLSALPFLAVGCKKKGSEPRQQASSEKVDAALLFAAEYGNIDQVRLLISKGGDVNAQDEKENTPLCRAVKSGKMVIVQLLVEAGADVNAMGKNGRTPLYMAVEKDNIAIAKYLIVHGADVNGGGENKPLQNAPYSRTEKMIELLLDKGADINAGP
jgi:ankyrin repeat protein